MYTNTYTPTWRPPKPPRPPPTALGLFNRFMNTAPSHLTKDQEGRIHRVWLLRSGDYDGQYLFSLLPSMPRDIFDYPDSVNGAFSFVMDLEDFVRAREETA